MEDTGLKTQWATAIGCKIDSEDQPNHMQDTQILEALELMMLEKKSSDTAMYASSEEETEVSWWVYAPISLWLDRATIRFRFFGPSSFNTALQLVLRPHFLVHFV
jgi:hypothetical protein